MKRTKVVHLTSLHAPFDTRIFYKECVTLAQAGYEVTMIAPCDQDERVHDVHIRAIPKPAIRKERIKRTVHQVYHAAIWEDGDLYHFHDPELFPVGVWLKLRGKKVVYDIHENLPAQILGKTYLRPALFRRFVAGGAVLSEKTAEHIFDGLVIANPRVAERFSGPNTITLANYPLITMIDEAPPVGNHPDKPVVIYVGGLTAIRGVCELIDAVDGLNGAVVLWLIGPWESEAFQSQCMKKSGWRHVRYWGYLTPQEVYGYLKTADIGMATLHPQHNYLTNLPVKAFEYMACSLPVVMSDFPYWREVFEKAAVFVNPQKPESIADAIRGLLEHPDKARMLGETGRSMVENVFSWEQEAGKLLALYERILSKSA
jgi:glycosyltransferase involved in cell wall biosynthesis